MKKFSILLLALGLLLALCGGCGSKEEEDNPGGGQDQVQVQEPEDGEPVQEDARPEEPVSEGSRVNLALPGGPAGVGAAKLISDSENGSAINAYNVILTADSAEAAELLTSGAADIAALDANAAAALYQQTNGGIQMAALNTLGGLYVLENGSSVQEVSDLAGRTVCAAGQGTAQELVLSHILRQNGLEPGKNVTVVFQDAAELAGLMAAGQIELCVLPVPDATAVLLENSEVRAALDLGEEWDNVSDGMLTMGCVVVRTQFAQEDPEAVRAFLEEYAASVDFVKRNVDEAAQMAADAGLMDSAGLAAAAIPQCGLVCITGEDIQPGIQAYYDILYAADPASLGGFLPDDGFYYIP